MRLILSRGALEAPQSLVFCFVLFCLRLLCVLGVCCREPAEPALCGQPVSEPAGRWMAWGTGRERCGGGGQSPGRAAALPLGSRAEAGCLTLRHVPAATLAATSRWSIRASAPPLCPARCSKVQFHLSLLRILRLTDWLWLLLRSRWILKTAAMEEQGGEIS